MIKYLFSGLFLFLASSAVLAKPLVVTSFSILGDMVSQLAQDKVEVVSLVGPNQDAHVFEPRPQHAKLLERADLILVNGLGFEGWMNRLINASGYKGTPYVATLGLTPLYHEGTESKIPDPHAWHSLENAALYVDNIVSALSTLLPEDENFFKARGRAYKKEIKKLSQSIKGELKTIPLEKRKVLTNHEAFSYLGHDFNIEFYSPLGMSTEAEASAKAIATLIEKVRKEGITALFVENILNPRLVNQIAKETGCNVAGHLYSDALDAPGTEADTYLKMMECNLRSLVIALKNTPSDSSNSP